MQKENIKQPTIVQSERVKSKKQIVGKNGSAEVKREASSSAAAKRFIA
jgi:hypothetical protein